MFARPIRSDFRQTAVAQLLFSKTQNFHARAERHPPRFFAQTRSRNLTTAAFRPLPRGKIANRRPMTILAPLFFKATANAVNCPASSTARLLPITIFAAHSGLRQAILFKLGPTYARRV